jgi:cell division protein FtsW
MFLVGGFFIVLICHSIPVKYYKILAFCLPGVWLLLIAVKLTGTSVNGADRWLSIGGFSFQPSELAKLFLIISVAFILSRRNYLSAKVSFYWILGLSSITCGIIFIDNFSTAAILFGIVIFLMFVGQIPFKLIAKLLLGLAVIGALFVLFIYTCPEDTLKKIFPRGATWKGRIEDFSSGNKGDLTAENKEDKYIITDDNYQVSHAKIAISQGGITGKLPGQSTERDFIPQAYSDFIYSIIIEEMGLIVGGIGMLFLYITLFFRAGIIANRSESLFSKYIVMGSAMILVIQALVNMAVAVNLIPVTGQPLPLVSRGGTSTLINCIYIGIILSVSRFDNPKGIKREEEIAAEALLAAANDEGFMVHDAEYTVHGARYTEKDNNNENEETYEE